MAYENLSESLYKHRFDTPYLKAKMDIRYEGNGQHFSFKGHLKMIKDSVIYLSLTKFGFPVAKVMITPDEMAGYETFGHSYFREKPEKVEKITGIPFHFDQLSSLFTGDPYPFVKDLEAWEIKESDNGILLSPRKTGPVREMYLNTLLKITQMLLAHEGKEARINFDSYKKYDTLVLPEEIRLQAGDNRIDIKMHKIQTPGNLDIHFHIPENYSRREL